ncbi:MAG: hypothetical protein V7L00_04780 [Nostoc sp.]|uniref:hypothetical protein n=1 Tax=Nostoc sp. TaxID=1180 RepID=UPI002FFB8927
MLYTTRPNVHDLYLSLMTINRECLSSDRTGGITGGEVGLIPGYCNYFSCVALLQPNL